MIGCGLPKITENNLHEGVEVDYIKNQPQGSPLKLVGVLRSEVSSACDKNGWVFLLLWALVKSHRSVQVMGRWGSLLIFPLMFSLWA